MQKNIMFAAIILTGCFCVWGYLAAQPDGEIEMSSVKSSLLEIHEPSLEDFEHCAKLAVNFLESISDDPTKTDIAAHELYDTTELPPQLAAMTGQLTYMKKDIEYGSPELIAKKSLGENVIVMYYNYRTDKAPLYCRFLFDRTFDRNGTPLKWQCRLFVFSSDMGHIMPTW
ncbi:MAG: hypothetical protein FWH27_11645 [Planctomycetaceae bacterium]|nr:hypothetical protein [Planctomycetaceae bacterium]